MSSTTAYRMGVSFLLLCLTACSSEGSGTAVTVGSEDTPAVTDGDDTSGVCTPECTAGTCGSDGCGGTCGCDATETCNTVTQVCEPSCTPQCDGRECGNDGCGANCGICPAAAAFCTAEGKCLTCLPNCEGRACGDDGCGGSCGICTTGTCDAAGQCADCETDCVGKDCGDDGCGGTCGTCTAGTCESGICKVCAPDCTGKDCGPDGCGGSCGPCTDGTCESGLCTCTPDCTDLECGDNGCGGSCGTCDFGTCELGLCECTAACNGKICGDDGCGDVCGTCPFGTCNASGTCDCTPDCDDKQCGDNGCGGTCGTCGAGPCDSGLCTLCNNNCLNKQCGDNGCGGTCGTCAAGVCGGGGEAGICDVCVPDTDCVLPGVANPCVTGKISCASGLPVCTAVNSDDGITCQVGKVCVSGTCVTCTDGATCDLDAPCEKGSTDCSGGVAQCLFDGYKTNGATCGTGSYCYEGSCDACTAGAECDIGEECKVGTTKCTLGESLCTGATKNKTTGTACSGGVCKAGACAACDAGGSCVSSLNPCQVGLTECSTGAPVCGSLTTLSNGSDCGGGNACIDGVCSACQPGLECDTGDACNPGAISCAGGSPSCQSTGSYLENGTDCGNGSVCSNGTCTACAADVACTPVDPCHAGKTSCANGFSECIDQGTAGPTGVPCSVGVCKAGTCNPCSEGAPCALSENPCVNATFSCTTGDPVCTSTGQPVSNGTACAIDQVCQNGVCKTCTEGKVCAVQGKPCRVGLTSCATGLEVCGDTGAYQPDGSTCGANNVCKAGDCKSCISGGSCSPDDECGVGVISCATGTAKCVVTGPKAGSNGTDCGGSGTCQGGHCQCAAGEIYYLNLCASCPVFNATTLYVDADSTVGKDNVCCGRSPTADAALGGPCLTISQGMANVPEANFSISVQGDTLGNMNSAERYPIQMSKGVTINLNAACVPGAPGSHVFVAATDGSTMALNYGTVGSTCQGGGSGALSALRVAPAPEGGSPTVNVSGVTFRRATIGVDVVNATATVYSSQFFDNKTGIKIDGSSVSATYVNIDGQMDYGVDCRSLNDAENSSNFVFYGGTVYSAKHYAFWAGHGCDLKIQYSGVGMGAGTSCPPVKRGTGVYLDGSSIVEITSTTIRCNANDGISLRQDPTDLLGDPRLVLSGSVINDNGCAGLSAEWGQVTAAWGNRFLRNHYGVVQKGSSPTTGGQVHLGGQDPNGNTSRNIIACNSKDTPGACCTKANCPNGYDILNNSGTSIVATYNMWQESPVGFAKCSPGFQSCTCAGIAGCTSPPADGIPIVNMPQGSGTPTVSTGNNAIFDGDYCNQ